MDMQEESISACDWGDLTYVFIRRPFALRLAASSALRLGLPPQFRSHSREKFLGSHLEKPGKPHHPITIPRLLSSLPSDICLGGLIIPAYG